MALEVTVNGLSDLIKDVKRSGGDAKPLVRAALNNSTNKIQHNIRQLVPKKTRTLNNSILTQVDYPEGKVQVQEKYGEYVEYGTGIYGPNGQPIRPKTKKALYFKVAGQPVFARSVKGQKAQPFFKPGVENSKSYVDEQFDKVTEILTRELAGKE